MIVVVVPVLVSIVVMVPTLEAQRPEAAAYLPAWMVCGVHIDVGRTRVNRFDYLGKPRGSSVDTLPIGRGDDIG